MENPLFILVKTSRKTIRQLAKEVGVSRQHIGQLIAEDDLLRNVKLSTYDKIAAGLGYKVQVNFIKSNGNKLLCPDCQSPNVERLNEVNLRCETCGHHFAR